MGGIAKKYKLDLDGAWNKVDIPHRGRHTKKYHQFVYKAMKKADEIAKGDQKKFLQEFNKRVRNPVLKNPAILRKIGADYLPK